MGKSYHLLSLTYYLDNGAKPVRGAADGTVVVDALGLGLALGLADGEADWA